MLEEPSDYQIFINKRTDKIYLSKALEQHFWERDAVEGIKQISRTFRIISKVINSPEVHQFTKDGKEIVLKVTSGQRHEVIAKFYEDTRGVFALTIQKFTKETGVPHNTSFTFIGDEIQRLYGFLRSIESLPIDGRHNQHYKENIVDELESKRKEAIKTINENPDLLAEILKNNITQADIINLAYRKDQLSIYKSLLSDVSYFNTYKAENKLSRDEAVWQHFFEKNTWIFGYGLKYIFNSPLEGRKLEQVVAGYNVFSSGKRIDALMHTKGIISTLCFGEIKTHNTPLLSREYRPECFMISSELAGGISQVQKTIQKSLKELGTKLELKDENRNPTGESVFLYQPKAFLVIGCLDEFQSTKGINEDKFSSFELFRRNITNPEIITFDELYERAKYIIESSEFV
jgi:hypothetical protein